MILQTLVPAEAVVVRRQLRLSRAQALEVLPWLSVRAHRSFLPLLTARLLLVVELLFLSLLTIMAVILIFRLIRDGYVALGVLFGLDWGMGVAWQEWDPL